MPFPLQRRALLAGIGGLGLASSLPRPAPAAASGLAVIGKDGWLFPLWDATARLDPTALRNVTQLIHEACSVLKAAGIETAIALVPSKVRTYRQFLPDDTKVAPETDKRYPLALAELSRSALVPDLDAVFRAARTAQPGQPLYFKTDTHWMPVAAELAAAEVAKQIREKLHLPASRRPGTRLGAVVTLTQPSGDLARFIPLAERGAYGPETYQIREAAASTDPAALVEDDSADTVVVGNSFMQPKYGFQAVLSNRLERPVALAWKPNNVGSFATLLDYVKGQAFKRNRPKLLVWNHLEVDIQTLPNSSSWGQNAMSPEAFLSALRAAVVNA